MNERKASLDWDADGRDWPNREMSRFVSARGIDWHIQRAGTGPKMLLVHGTAATTHSWAGVLPLLSRCFDVLAPDLPGHGFSSHQRVRQFTLPAMAGAMGALLSELDFEPAVVVGHSAGAAILVRMCLDGDADPRVLVSLNGALLPFPGLGGLVFPAMAKMLFLNDFVPYVFTRQAQDATAVRRVIEGTGSKIGEREMMLYARLFRSRSHVSGALAMMAQWDLEALKRDLPKLRTPVELVAAENDKAVPSQRAFETRDLMPGAHVEYVRHLGHLAHEEDPDRIADLIVALATRHEALPQPAVAG